MRAVQLTVGSVTCPAARAYARIAEFERYPELVAEVRSVIVHDSPDGAPMSSDWEVYFRNGPLRWSEVDYFQPEQRRIVFEQTTGDFDIFRGTWRVESVDAGCAVHFEAAFDFGIPSLAGILEPVAEKVLKEGIAVALFQLLGDAQVIDDAAVAAAVAAKLALSGVASEGRAL
ncbi:type II toxin-antitoxin system RatA family toxin [Nocardia pseudobrasiliensis]|uniref:Polyketide cyclase/dehydrase/lipid transport protein n=1 Tax=Nocardia pseudobrasiliensis TaxID=45979 RepID=A0A370IBS6_9NOCA|nr:SRPBCC family protein [Nocardia pseudobrasiliensis]RDI66854.1 polyketide cyclase/dehydrase/lipid transport protein [Nocardia pseudobrasiliensis]